MNLNEMFISDENEYQTFYQKINNIFNSESNFPKEVFKDEYFGFRFEEFDWAMSIAFWEILKKMALETNDEYILLAVLEPHPYNYFYKEFNFFNWIKIPIIADGNMYFDLLEYAPQNSFADAVLYNSTTVIWTVPSLQWGIWGVRDYGVCALGSKNGTLTDEIEELKTWKHIDEAIESWIAPNFSERLIPYEFKELMLKNYSE
ncbi:MAG: hypothetical protein VB106_17125 [Clostridiaceae bacterium]|nr:hypothetical protein [Clostridiaceae bacterium]